MNKLGDWRLFSLLILAAGCTSIQATTEIHKGRMALRSGMTEVAIAHSEQATAFENTRIYSPLRESAWTYLGRANYEAKKYSAARTAIQRALEINRDDGLARLYLGLTLAREGNQPSARKEVLGGLQSLHETLEHIVYNTSSGPYWDPGSKIRNELRAAQGEVAAANSHWDNFFSRLESIGASVEQEIDLARRDESFDQRRNSGGDM